MAVFQESGARGRHQLSVLINLRPFQLLHFYVILQYVDFS